jgi:hypothetical protein
MSYTELGRVPWSDRDYGAVLKFITAGPRIGCASGGGGRRAWQCAIACHELRRAHSLTVDSHVLCVRPHPHTHQTSSMLRDRPAEACRQRAWHSSAHLAPTSCPRTKSPLRFPQACEHWAAVGCRHRSRHPSPRRRTRAPPNAPAKRWLLAFFPDTVDCKFAISVEGLLPWRFLHVLLRPTPSLRFCAFPESRTRDSLHKKNKGVPRGISFVPDE